MIIVRVELHSAITRDVTELARLRIANVGGTGTKGDYEVNVYRGRNEKTLARNTVMHVGHVQGHARLALHVWHLVAKALKSVGYGEK